MKKYECRIRFDGTEEWTDIRTIYPFERHILEHKKFIYAFASVQMNRKNNPSYLSCIASNTLADECYYTKDRTHRKYDPIAITPTGREAYR